MLKGQATKRIALYAVIDRLDDCYSLTRVLTEQAKMLLLHGYPTEIWLLDNWRLEDDPGAQALLSEFPDVVFKPILPRLKLYDWADHYKDADSYASETDETPKLTDKALAICAAIAPHLQQIDAVLMHDLLFQSWYLPHGLAVRQAGATHPAVRWFHWQHSGPSPRPALQGERSPYASRFTPMEGCRFVYVNEDPAERLRVAAMRNIPERELAFVPNSRDILEYLDVPAKLKQWARYWKLLEAELLIVIPARLDEGKQPKKAVLFTQALRQCGVDARLVWIAAASNVRDRRHREYANALFDFAGEIGLESPNFLVTHIEDPAWADGCDAATVRGFQQLADLFILPSLSEANSLVAMEAALAKNLMVLNEDFPALPGGFPANACYQAHFGSRLVQTQYHPEGEDPRVGGLQHELNYYTQVAARFLYERQFDPAWRAFSFVKRERNLEFCFKRFLEPLLWSF